MCTSCKCTCALWLVHRYVCTDLQEQFLVFINIITHPYYIYWRKNLSCCHLVSQGWSTNNHMMVANHSQDGHLPGRVTKCGGMGPLPHQTLVPPHGGLSPPIRKILNPPPSSHWSPPSSKIFGALRAHWVDYIRWFSKIVQILPIFDQIKDKIGI